MANAVPVHSKPVEAQLNTLQQLSIPVPEPKHEDLKAVVAAAKAANKNVIVYENAVRVDN